MADVLPWPTIDGQEFQLGDMQNIAAVAGLADDRILAELLRLAPYDGSNIYKAVVPYGVDGLAVSPGSGFPGATVAPSGSANGSIAVNPFRLVVGSRNTPAGAPAAPNPAGAFQSNALANWRDVRSGNFIGSASALSLALPLAPNSSGFNRWDLVYAVISPDANGPSFTRRVKNPSTNAVAASGVPIYLQSPVTVGVVQGTPSGTPALPSLPVDAGGNYYYPLGYVRVPNGFTASSTVATTDIRAFASKTSRYRVPGVGDFRAGTGNNDIDGTYATNFGWNPASSPSRPAPFLPPDWVGNVVHRLVELDFSTASPSHPNGSVADSSIDWRNRFIMAFTQVDSSNKFANDPTLGGGFSALPWMNESDVRANTSGANIQLSNTFMTDTTFGAGTAGVYSMNHTNNSACANTGSFGLYVMQTAGATQGQLLVSLTGTPSCRCFVWIMASPQFPNK